MEIIYVISTAEKARENIYKIGRHKGIQNKLITRYKTSLMNPFIYFAQNCENYAAVEKEIFKELKNYRIKDNENRKTEWVQLKLIKIIKTINGILKSKDTLIKDNTKCKIIDKEPEEKNNTKSNNFKSTGIIDTKNNTTFDRFKKWWEKNHGPPKPELINLKGRLDSILSFSMCGLCRIRFKKGEFNAVKFCCSIFHYKCLDMYMKNLQCPRCDKIFQMPKILFLSENNYPDWFLEVALDQSEYNDLFFVNKITNMEAYDDVDTIIYYCEGGYNINEMLNYSNKRKIPIYFIYHNAETVDILESYFNDRTGLTLGETSSEVLYYKTFRHMFEKTGQLRFNRYYYLSNANSLYLSSNARKVFYTNYKDLYEKDIPKW